MDSFRNQALEIFTELIQDRFPKIYITPQHEPYILTWLREHSLAGVFFKYRDLFTTAELKDFLTVSYKTNSLRNLIFLEEYKKLSGLCQKQALPTPVALKGLSFINRIYSAGERAMTDIDILFPEKHLPALEQLLVKTGYKYMPEKKWHANHHKKCFSKTVLGLDVTLEVHTKLFYNQPEKFEMTFINLPEMKILAPALETVYLSAHWVHQHTMLKLFWLVDLHRLAADVPDAWSTQTWELAERLRLKTSLGASAHCLRRLMGHKLDRAHAPAPQFLSLFLNWPTLVQLNSRRWHYLCMKHTTKDSFSESLSYDAGWLYFRVKNLLLNANRSKEAAL